MDNVVLQNLIKAQNDYIMMLQSGRISDLMPVVESKLDKVPMFCDYINVFMAQHEKTMKKSSFCSYKYYLTSGISEYFKDYRLDEITSKLLQDFANKELEKYSVRTVKEKICLIKNILHSAEDEELIQPKKYKVKLPKNNKPNYRVLNDEEFDKLYDYCIQYKHPNSIGILLALELGLRIGEVCGLKWSDVDFDNKKVEIKRNISRIFDYETGKTEVITQSPKTQKSARKIFITNKFTDILKNKKGNSDTNSYIITGTKSPAEPRTLRAFLKRRLEKLEIPHIKFHELRHTFATRAIEKNIDPKTVAEILGHENCDITLNIYTNCTEKMMRNAMEILS